MVRKGSYKRRPQEESHGGRGVISRSYVYMYMYP